MANTSGTFNFQSIEIEKIISEAYRNIGLAKEFLTPEHLESANTSLNLLLLDFENRSNNLWTLDYAYMALLPYTNQYLMSNTVSKILQMNLRTYTRQLEGAAQTNTTTTYDNGGGGEAIKAFDGNSATACTQNVQGGNISYDYGVGITNQINFIGLQFNSNVPYSITIEYSQDTATWSTLYTLPALQSYVVGDITWFDIPTPISARAYRVRETGTAILNVQEIYFNNNTNDFPLANISRWDDFARPQKKMASRPNTYYFNRKISPILSILPVPTDTYNCIRYSYVKKMQDVGNFYTNTVEIPSHFYSPLVWGLSFYLAIKYDLTKADKLEMLYEKSLSVATLDDSETVDITFNVNYDGGYY